MTTMGYLRKLGAMTTGNLGEAVGLMAIGRHTCSSSILCSVTPLTLQGYFV